MSTTTKVVPPYQPFIMLCDMEGIAYGKVYLGLYGFDPTAINKQIPVYTIDDDGNAVKAVQPLRTNEAGFLSLGNVPTNFYVYNRYSMLVKLSNDQTHYYEHVEGNGFGLPVPFDFRDGGTITRADQVIFNPKKPGDNFWYHWTGTLPKTVPPNTTPLTTGGVGVGKWLKVTESLEDDDEDEVLRADLAANTGATMVGTSTGETVEARFASLTPGEVGAAPAVHTHPISQVTGLQAALDGKAAVVHTHVIADTTGLQAALDGKSATSHTHTAAQVGALALTGGTLTGPVTGTEFKTPNNPTVADDLARKGYVDNLVTSLVIPMDLGDLTDVNDSISSIAVEGDVLTYTSGAWTSRASNGTGGGATTLGQLTDVIDDITDVAVEGDVIVFNSSSGQWVAGSPIGSLQIGDLTDVEDDVSGTATDGDVLTFSVGSWHATPLPLISGAHVLGDLEDVIDTVTSGSASGHVLTYDGTQWITAIPAPPSAHTHAIADVTNLQSTLDGKAASVHTHTIAQVTSLQAALDGKQALDATLTAMAGAATAANTFIYFSAADTAAMASISNFGRTLIDDADAATARGTIGAAATAHTHAIADVTNLQSSLDGKSATSHSHTPASIGAAAAAHTHAIADVSGLQAALDGKSATSHTHAYLPLTGGTLTGNLTAPDVYITSDRRLKSNFGEILNALDKIDELCGMTYDKSQTLGDDAFKREAGLIADDVEKVLPEAIHEYGLDKIKTISPYAMIALLVEGMKELRREIKDMKRGRS